MPDVQRILALAIVGSFVGLIVLWTFRPPAGDPAQITAMLNTLIGILAGAAGAVVGFYFGSSKSSASKDDTIASLANNQPPAPPAPPAPPQPPQPGP